MDIIIWFFTGIWVIWPISLLYGIEHKKINNLEIKVRRKVFWHIIFVNVFSWISMISFTLLFLLIFKAKKIDTILTVSFYIFLVVLNLTILMSNTILCYKQTSFSIKKRITFIIISIIPIVGIIPIFWLYKNKCE